MRVCVLGPVVIEGDAGPVAVPGTKARQILTALALRAPRSATLDQLVELLWVDPPAAAAKTVQSHLSRLRRVLADAGAPGALSGGGTDYRLELDDRLAILDVHEVAQLTRRAGAARAAAQPALAADLAGRARARWRGELELPDTPGGEALRRTAREQLIELSVSHLSDLIDAGEAERAVADLGELVATEPLNERLWELRIRALYRSGRPTDALRALHDVTTLLADEVGVAPGPALRALEAAILAHDDALVVAGSASPAVGSPGGRGDIAYARAGTTHIAHRTFGDAGTTVLLLNAGMISIDSFPDEPHLARGLARLADRRRVVAFDPRGIGLSDRTQAAETITVEDWVDDALSVLDALGRGSTHVFAGGNGGLVALSLAAQHPERVRSLTLVNPFVRFTTGDGYPYGIPAETWAHLQESLQSTGATPRVDSLTLVSPSVAADPEYRAWWDSAGRRAASPAAAAALLSTTVGTDLRGILPCVAAPSLVVVRRGCPAYDPGHGEYVAAHLPNATLVRHHDVNEPWWIGDTDFVLTAFERFLAALPGPPSH